MRTFRIALLSLALAFGVSSAANAATLTIGDSRYLGLIEFGLPSGTQEQIDYLNFLKGLTPGQTVTSPATGDDDVDAQDYFRSSNTLCSPTCPVVVEAGSFNSGSSPSNTGIATGYTYLYAKYDGPNFGVAVWYIAGLTGTIDIPQNGSDGQFGLSHYTLYNPFVCTSPTQPGCDSDIPEVPEPGTLLMFGTGLALLAARLRRRQA